MKKIIALLLSLCMMLALCACGGSEIEYYENDGETAETTEAAETAETAEAAETTGLAGPGYDAYPGEMVVGTVNGEEVTWMEYYYWLYYYNLYVNQLAASYGVTLTGWDVNELSSTDTNGEVVVMNAQYAVTQHHAIQTKADEMGIVLSEEDQALIDQVFELNADSAAGDADGVCTEEEAAAFEAYLAEQNVDKAFFDYLNETSLLSERLYAAVYGEMGADYPEEDILAYAEENGILSAKHILLLTQDMTTGEALSEDEAAAKLATAEDLLAQLQAVESDPVALEELFDQLTAEYTEDTGYAYYPEGYVFGEGEMVAEFENAVKELDSNYGLSGIVESSYGYHIILRTPITPESSVGTDSYGNAVNMRSAVTSNLFNDQMASWIETASVSWSEGFEALDLNTIFG